MEQYKTMKQALKDGWKIGSILYDMTFQEFAFSLYRNDYNPRNVCFWLKKIPSYLKKDNFLTAVMDTDYKKVIMTLYLKEEQE